MMCLSNLLVNHPIDVCGRRIAGLYKYYQQANVCGLVDQNQSQCVGMDPTALRVSYNLPLGAGLSSAGRGEAIRPDCHSNQPLYMLDSSLQTSRPS